MTIKAYTHYLYFCHQNKTFIKNYAFYFTKKAPFIFKIFKFLYFPLPVFFSWPLLNSKVHDIIMLLNLILKTDSLISGEVKF